MNKSIKSMTDLKTIEFKEEDCPAPICDIITVAQGTVSHQGGWYIDENGRVARDY